MSPDDGGLWPQFGALGDVKLAVAAIKRELGQLAPTQLSPEQRESASSAPLSDLERDLLDLMFVQARLSAHLMQLVEHYSRQSGTCIDAGLILDTIQAHAQAQADLATLDERFPFDA